MTLRVTVEVVPFGSEENKKVLSVLNIHNRGVIAGHDYCHYDVEESPTEGPVRPWNGVAHARANGFWTLILKALLANE